jgi:hypothetical protein
MIAPRHVTPDALTDLAPDHHPATLRSEMTLLAADRIGGDLAVSLMGESEIRGRRRTRRAPGNASFDGSLVTGGTSGRVRPERGFRVARTQVTRGT